MLSSVYSITLMNVSECYITNGRIMKCVEKEMVSILREDIYLSFNRFLSSFKDPKSLLNLLLFFVLYSSEFSCFLFSCTREVKGRRDKKNQIKPNETKRRPF